jgi:methyltransferase FkbM-like protein
MELNGARSHLSVSFHPQNLFILLFPTSLGHTFIDVLKIDIEGGEFDALTPFIATYAEGVLPVGQLQLEIHAFHGRERFDYFIKWWTALEAVGLRPFWTEPNLVYVNIVRGAAAELAEVCPHFVFV